MALRKFIIERDIPGAGSLEREQLRGAAAKSNGVLRDLGPDIQWVESFVAADKTFCVYLAKDEAIIKKRLSEASSIKAGRPIVSHRVHDRTSAGQCPAPGGACRGRTRTDTDTSLEGCPYVRVSGALAAWHSDAEAPANGVRFGRCYRRGL